MAIFVLILVASNAIGIENELFEKILIFCFIGTYIAGLGLKFYGLGTTKDFDGELDGFLVFDFNQITIKDRAIDIADVANISIDNNDYYGRQYANDRNDLNPASSNGSGNFAVITLKSGETLKTQFIMGRSDDFQKIRKELIGYHVKGKIALEALSNILGERSSNEIELLKSEITAHEIPAPIRQIAEKARTASK